MVQYFGRKKYDALKTTSLMMGSHLLSDIERCLIVVLLPLEIPLLLVVYGWGLYL